MEIKNHKLVGDGANWAESPNHRGNLDAPEFIVMHFTAGRDAASSIKWLCNPAAKASAHIVVGRNGTITQLVGFDQVAWHAGASTWAGKHGLNASSIGIELDNMGELTRVGDRYLSWFKSEVPANQVQHAAHAIDGVASYWHDYTELQIASALTLVDLLRQAYPTIKEVLGHDDIAPRRKRDPGPAFPMRSFRARFSGRQSDDDAVYVVTEEGLNIRTKPGVENAVVAPPLAKGTQLRMQVRQSQWSQVGLLEHPELVGWVNNAYIREG